MDNEKTPPASLRDFLHVVFKRKIQILIFFIVTVLTVTILSLMVSPTYEAAAQILVKIGRENVFVPPVPAGATPTPVISLDQEERINSEIEILKSQFLAEKLVETFGPTTLYKDLERPARPLLRSLLRSIDTQLSPVQRAVIKLQKDLTIEAVRKSSVINISFKHTDPQLAARTVNTLVTFYLDQHVRVHKNPESYQFFQDQSQLLKHTMKRAEEKLERFKSEHNITSLEEQRALLLRSEAERRAALNQTLSQEAETEGRLRQLRDQLAGTPKTIALEEETDHNPYAVSNLQVRLVELELKEHELLRKYNDQNPLVQGVRDEIRMVRQKLAEQEGRRYGKTRAGVNPTYQALNQEHLRTEAEFKALHARKESQSAQLVDHQKRLETLNGIELQLTRLQQEVELDRQNYRLYLTKFEESRVSNAMDTQKISNVSVIQPALPPVKPVSPKIVLNLVLATVLGTVGAFGLAFFSEYLDDRLERTEDVENHLHLPILASIPEQKT